MGELLVTLVVVLLAVSVVFVSSAQAELVLVRKRQPLATVVIAEDAPKDVCNAAEVLVEYVGKSTGAMLKIREYREEELDDVLIHVGADPYVKRAMPDLCRLDEDGFVIRTVDRPHLIIAGSTPRGTEYGVYDFLERFIGVRWLLPGPWGEHVPSRTDLTIPTVEIREGPAFLSRAQAGFPTEEQRIWAQRMRLHTRFAGSGHNIVSLFPPETYTKTHPEFFPIVDGKRLLPPSNRYWKWHPCFTAEGLAEEAAENIKRYFREHPEANSYSIAVNDGPVTCEAETGPPMHGGKNNWLGNRHISEEYFRWANQVAERVMEEFPDKWLGCLGYTNVFQAPSTVKVHPRIIVFHCYDRHKWIHPELEREGHRIAEEWRAVCPHMAWYDYTFGASFMVPRVYFHHMGTYLRYARDISVMAMLGESSHNWAEGPKWYLMAKLYWNPDLDVDELLKEWYETAVGPEAAPYLAAYYAHWEKFWTKRILKSEAFSLKGQQWLPIQDDTYFDVLRMEDFSESRRLLEKTVAEVRTEAQKERAKMLLRGFEYYEASAMAHLPDYDAGRAVLRSAEEALALINKAPAAAEAAVKRRAIDEELKKDPVLVRSTLDWPATERSGWGSYPLWRAFDWIASDKTVRARVEEMTNSPNEVLSVHAKALLDVVDAKITPLQGTALGPDSKFRTLTVEDDTRLAEEPGSRMDNESWWLTVGDDVIPFWNAPHRGKGGRMRYVSTGGRSGSGMVVCEGVGFGTIRKTFKPVKGMVTALCFVRVPEGVQTKGRVVLNLWEIALADGNPCPSRTVAYPQPGVWTPVAVTGNLKAISCYSKWPVDYLLLELEVAGFGDGERLEVSDMAIWPHK